MAGVQSGTLFKWNVEAAADCLDQSQNYLTDHLFGLGAVFCPKSIAVLGATDRTGAVGKTVLENLLKCNVDGKFQVFPINPTRSTVCGLTAYKSVKDVPMALDLAVVVTPAKTVKDVMIQCGEKEVKGVVVISAGFKEIGPEGLHLENEVIETARKYGIRVVGPNCLGIMNPNHGLNATFAADSALPGSIAFMSQSGAMCTAVLDWSLKEKIGFSSFVSIGSMADVNWGDLIDYLGNDPQTSAILIYMETIGDAAHFLSAAKSVAMMKPIIVIKAGQTQAAAAAAASHTGSLAGSHDAFLAAMRRVGVLVVNTIGDLFDCALVLGKQPRPRGPNLMIITNAGGPGVLATDATAMNGAEMSPLEESTFAELNSFLPAAWSHANPVDVLGDAGADLYAKTLEVCMKDKNADGVLVILSPQSVTEPLKTAEAVVAAFQRMQKAGTATKPILCSWMGGTQVSEGYDFLNKSGIPTFQHPDAAAKTFAKIYKQSRELELMNQIPGVEVDAFTEFEKREFSVSICKAAQEQGRDLLTEAESKQVLKAFNIPIAETIVCATKEEAVASGQQLGFPCVVKLHSETITHKSDVGGVVLNIHSTQHIENAWESIRANVDKIGPQHFQGVTVQPMIKLDEGIELILGSLVDNQFGPLVLFGTGGCMVEIFKDSSLGIPPLNPTLAQRQIEDTKIYTALKGGHGQRFPGVDLSLVNKTLVRFSQMVCDLSSVVSEIDINPLLALKDRVVALDARIVLRKPTDPLPVLAIRPYPCEYVSMATLKSGETITFRPSHANDFDKFVTLHKKLGKETIRQRYLKDVSLEERMALQYISYTVCADYDRMIALCGFTKKDGKEEMVAIARLVRWPKARHIAELKVAVIDEYQGRGLGSKLVDSVLEVAKTEKVKTVQALVLEENTGFLKLLKARGFHTKPAAAKPTQVECTLQIV